MLHLLGEDEDEPPSPGEQGEGPKGRLRIGILLGLAAAVLLVGVLGYTGYDALADLSERQQRVEQSHQAEQRWRQAEAAQADIVQVVETVVNKGSGPAGCALLTDGFIDKYSQGSRSKCRNSPNWKDLGLTIEKPEVSGTVATVVASDSARNAVTLTLTQDAERGRWLVDDLRAGR